MEGPEQSSLVNLQDSQESCGYTLTSTAHWLIAETTLQRRTELQSTCAPVYELWSSGAPTCLNLLTALLQAGWYLAPEMGVRTAAVATVAGLNAERGFLLFLRDAQCLLCNAPCLLYLLCIARCLLVGPKGPK